MIPVDLDYEITLTLTISRDPDEPLTDKEIVECFLDEARAYPWVFDVLMPNGEKRRIDSEVL